MSTIRIKEKVSSSANQTRRNVKRKPVLRKKSQLRSSNNNIRPRLSECAGMYAMSLANPYTGPLACVPTFPSITTRKFRTFVRGVFNCGTVIGFIVMDPFSMAFNNNTQAVVSSALGFLGPNIDFSAIAANVSRYASNSDYTQADFGDEMGQGLRVVSAGLRVQYAGSLLNVGGISYSLQEPNHVSLQNYTLSDMGAYNESERERIEPEGWISLYYKPVVNDEISLFRNQDYAAVAPASGAYSSSLTNYLGIMLYPSSVGSLFNFEAYATFEASGAEIRGKTPSSSDPVGFGAIDSITANSNFDHTAPSLIGKFLKESSFKVGQYALEYGKAQITNLITQPTSTRLFIS